MVYTDFDSDTLVLVLFLFVLFVRFVLLMMTGADSVMGQSQPLVQQTPLRLPVLVQAMLP